LCLSNDFGLSIQHNVISNTEWLWKLHQPEIVKEAQCISVFYQLAAANTGSESSAINYMCPLGCVILYKHCVMWAVVRSEQQA
jgi:hypothetical protein